MSNTTDFNRIAIAMLGTIVFSGACLFGSIAPVAAAPVTRTVAVAYGDLNLAKPGGRTALHARITSAARSVCHNGGRDLASQIIYNRCVKTAIAAANAQAAGVPAS